MLFALRHGQRILTDKPSPLEAGLPRSRSGDYVALEAAAGVSQQSASLEAGASEQPDSFGYFFPNAEGDSRSGMAEAFSVLAAAMIEADGEDESGNAPIAPIMTYFGQFIDHDITASHDGDVQAPDGSAVSAITGPSIDPVERDLVTAAMKNLRLGELDLDSLYGDGPSETAFTSKVKMAMRDPDDRARMRTGPVLQLGAGNTIPVAKGDRGDLPRLGDVLDDPHSGLSEADIDALTDPDLKSVFKTDQVHRWNALIGDGRNDENLIVAQLHLAFLHFHNAVADDLKATVADPDLRFDEARRRTTWIYQWLVVNDYLPAVCDPAIVDAVKSSGAALYADFRSRVAPQEDVLPMPLEFSVAAFRFGHSMVRGAYDHNRIFGRPGRPTGATFDELFSFTGGGKLGQFVTGQVFDRLVSNWPIDWDRFTKNAPDHADRLSRKIDTHLAHPLSVMLNEGEGAQEPVKSILKHLADRNLRRGYRLNIPTGQATVTALNAFDASSSSYTEGGGATAIQPLTPDELTRGVTGQALADADLVHATPLWFYVLKEAEERAQGDHLGPLGSRLVAETLIGLIVADPDSYWHAGTASGTWTPDETPVAGKIVRDLTSMLQIAAVMPSEVVPA